MVSTVIAASFAFMLPVATPPNAIIFSSRYVTIPQMMKAGIWLNLIGVVLISLFVMFLLPVVWGIDIHLYPETHVPR
jgi:sodium-dependent dicarboxylate transporter 2/3/5